MVQGQHQKFFLILQKKIYHLQRSLTVAERERACL